MLALPLLSLFACAPPPPAYAPDLSAYTGAEASCLQAHCAASASAEAFGSCRAAQCAATPATWAVNPTLLRYDEGVVTVSVEVEHTPGQYGDAVEAAPGETWLGATVLTSKGEEIDMAVQTVFPDRLGDPFTFSSEVGPDVEVVIVGLWGQKIEPCDSTRSGCQMFGFVLDKSLAAWPPDTYVESPPRRQRFLPSELSVQFNAGELGDARAKSVVDGFTQVLGEETRRFGATYALTDQAVPVPVGAAATTPPTSVVLHKNVNDGPLASRVAARLSEAMGFPVPVRHDPAAAADLVMALGTYTCPPGEACK